MSVLKLTVVPSFVLRKVSSSVECDKKLITTIKDLCDTLVSHDNPKGVGLSAPQIGKNWNVFATFLSPNFEEEAGIDDLRIFVNPTIVAVSNELTYGADGDEPILEGCLSIPARMFGR